MLISDSKLKMYNKCKIMSHKNVTEYPSMLESHLIGILFCKTNIKIICNK